MSKFPPMRRVDFPMRSSFLHLILEDFPMSKFSSSALVGKIYLSTFQNKWNFWILSPFSPPKMSSPNTASCVAKKGQKGHFWGVFDPFGSSKLVKISWPCEGIHIFAWKIQKCWVFLQSRSLAKARARWRGAPGRKTCFLVQKFKIYKKYPKFLEIWAECPSLSAVLG